MHGKIRLFPKSVGIDLIRHSEAEWQYYRFSDNYLVPFRGLSLSLAVLKLFL